VAARRAARASPTGTYTAWGSVSNWCAGVLLDSRRRGLAAAIRCPQQEPNAMSASAWQDPPTITPMTDFLASMPVAYARAFDAADVDEHAQIVARRGRRVVHAELHDFGAGQVVCLVTDDRRGLLSLVTDALLVHALGIDGAQAYVRRRGDGQPEVVALLDLSRIIDDAELAAFVQTLGELIAEDIRVSALPHSVAPPREASRRVYFELDALRRGEHVLMVEAPDAEGLVHAITSALDAQGVRILACQIGTESGVAHDRFEIAASTGERLGAIELCDIQLAVLDALPRGPSRNPFE
jgi:UTP:GlnB (protein PII) uridylyltransferase